MELPRNTHLKADVELALQTRAFAVVFESAKRVALTNIVLASLLVFGTGLNAANPWSTLWVVAIGAVYSLRIWVARRFLRLPNGGREYHQGFRRLIIASGTLSGMTWGVGVASLWPVADPSARIILVMVVSGLIPSAASTLSAIVPAFAGFVVPLWLAVGFSLGRSAETLGDIALTIASFGLVPMLIRGARTLHAEFVRATTLAVEQAALSRELEEARDQALLAAAARTEFLSVMSHELRTPLNGVVGLTSLLVDSRLDADQRSLAHGIRDSANMLLDLLNDVLDLSRIDAHQVELEVGDFSLRTELAQLHTLFSYKAKEKNLPFRITIDPALPDSLRGDWFRLRQVLVNLVGNAVKFTEHGSIDCVVRKAPAVNAVRFEVRDSGVGMTPSQVARLFQPFVQAERSTARRYGGSGLGLSISKRLVELMGGTLSVESTPGVGSVFFFEVVLPPALAAIASKHSARRSTAPGRRVLVCDDNEVNLRVAERLLQRAGYIVEKGRDGAEALSWLGRQHFDVVLMDLQMPGMSGFEALKRARDTKLANGVPFIALTASALASERDACREAGFDAFLTKPIDPDVLVHTIDEACAKAAA